ncbi:MAG TPA: DUF4189 domain-containing protein [Microvirga sp.]|jgi:hypothetical protein|nr:DUF4189 domain-containing protein [Microvirga sp.]
MKSVRSAVLALSLLSCVPAWALGAIAVDSEQGQRAGDEGYGIGWGNTRAAASADALRACRRAGNESCRVLVWFETCGAYAANRSTYGVGWGRTQEDAEEMALEKCGRCRIVLSECE